MAVYTQLGAEDLANLIAEFDVGALVSAKGIAEGVSNSNWLVDTTGRDAERLYAALGYHLVAVLPGYALEPDGAMGPTSLMRKDLADA